jgi:hypothetical protein
VALEKFPGIDRTSRAGEARPSGPLGFGQVVPPSHPEFVIGAHRIISPMMATTAALSIPFSIADPSFV